MCLPRPLLTDVARALFCVVFFTPFLGQVVAKPGYGPGEQEWGHISVRQGANMFYWLFYVQNVNVKPEQRPLVIWLQGGPGADSTGYGNFAEIGPLHVNGSSRSATWVKYANLLFIDNPVGAGWSHVEKASLLTTSNEQIGADMVSFMRKFYSTYPVLKQTPLYFFSESYGGKMAVEMAKQLEAAKLGADFRGLVLGDSWISPIDTVNSWAPFLFNAGIVDQNGHDEIAAAAANVQNLVNNGQWKQATNAWSNLQDIVDTVSYGVNFYNILSKRKYGFSTRNTPKILSPLERLFQNHVAKDVDGDIKILMEGLVKQNFGIDRNITFAGQRIAVFHQHTADFMKPVTSVVEELLNTTSLQVVVLTGQLDLIVDTPGTVLWVDRLEWSGADRWDDAQRTPLMVDGYIEGYVKNVDRLTLYWVERAGHMIPKDNPSASVAILRKIIGV